MSLGRPVADLPTITYDPKMAQSPNSWQEEAVYKKLLGLYG